MRHDQTQTDFVNNTCLEGRRRTFFMHTVIASSKIVSKPDSRISSSAAS